MSVTLAKTRLVLEARRRGGKVKVTAAIEYQDKSYELGSKTVAAVGNCVHMDEDFGGLTFKVKVCWEKKSEVCGTAKVYALGVKIAEVSACVSVS